MNIVNTIQNKKLLTAEIAEFAEKNIEEISAL
jgi:hypothetical protein